VTACGNLCRRGGKKRSQIDSYPFGNKACQKAQDRPFTVQGSCAGRAGEMGTADKNLVDHSAAGAARTHFEEYPHPLAVGGVDYCRVVDPFQRLGKNRISRTLAIDLERALFGAAVEGYPGRGISREEMQVAIRLGNFTGNFAVDGCYPGKREKAASQDGDDPLDPFGITADYAFIGSIDNQQVDPCGHPDCPSDFSCRGADHADLPIHLLSLGYAPGSGRCPALTGKIVGKKGRVVHLQEHTVALLPCFQGKQSGRFTEAVADDGSRGNSKAADDVADCTAGCNLSKNDRPVIVVHSLCRRPVPEHLRLELAPQIEVFAVLTTEYLRPAAGKSHPHPGEMIPGAGEDKTYFGVISKRCR